VVSAAGAATSASNRLAFEGTALQFLGWILLSILAILAIFPIAWVMAAAARWFCRNLRFGDGTVATFHGEGKEILGWSVLYSLIVIAQAIVSIVMRGSSFVESLAANIVAAILLCAVGLQILKWFCSRTELSSVGGLRFTGKYVAYAGWVVLIQLAAYTIVGWAWAIAGMYRWTCRNIQGQGLRFRFLGKGHQILWRGLVAILGCIVIVTIPWMVMWVMRWMIGQIETERA
jgi:uncharacterized membrane protein YjgN (DUF898 family)